MRNFVDCKAILFDLGGTLDSDGEHWLDRFYELYEQADAALPRDEIKRVFYAADRLCCGDPKVLPMGLRPLMKHHVSLQFGLLKVSDPAMEEEFVERFCAKTERIFERNAGLLKRLKPVFKMGVVSNFYGNAETVLREAGVAESLKVILDSTRLGVGKPDPEIFRIAAERLGEAPAGIIFVGDSHERDIEPARALGMKTIWLKGPKPRIPENAQPADRVISSLLEVESIVL
jgi:putative hydrolase of the HAD superfamily